MRCAVGELECAVFVYSSLVGDHGGAFCMLIPTIVSCVPLGSFISDRACSKPEFQVLPSQSRHTDRLLDLIGKGGFIVRLASRFIVLAHLWLLLSSGSQTYLYNKLSPFHGMQLMVPLECFAIPVYMYTKRSTCYNISLVDLLRYATLTLVTPR
jgi:hypothetical protein